MLTADGEVRPVILSELGYSSSQGEINQAAAFAYAYYAAENNPYIKRSFCPDRRTREKRLHRDLHWDCPLRADSINIFTRFTKNIDQVNSNSYTEFAKSVIGITNWSEVIQPAN